MAEVALVLSVEADDTALAEVGGRLRRIPLVVVTAAGDAVAPGDWLLVHTGLAVARITAAQAADHLTLQAQGAHHENH